MYRELITRVTNSPEVSESIHRNPPEDPHSSTTMKTEKKSEKRNKFKKNQTMTSAQIFVFVVLFGVIQAQFCPVPGRWVSLKAPLNLREDAAYLITSNSPTSFTVMPSTPVPWNSGVGQCSDNIYIIAGNPRFYFIFYFFSVFFFVS